jgi:hypothetical protein
VNLVRIEMIRENKLSGVLACDEVSLPLLVSNLEWMGVVLLKFLMSGTSAPEKQQGNSLILV